MSDGFAFDPSPDGYGRVLVGIHMRDRSENAALLKAVEAGLRVGRPPPVLLTYRVELMNMRWRAFVESWRGWD